MRFFSIFLIVILVALGMGSIFVVHEGRKAIVIQFGKVNKDSSGETVVYDPGLHFKLPFFDRVRILDARIQTLDDPADRFVTSEKKDLLVDSYIKWRVQDFAKYYLSTGGIASRAEVLLKQKVINGLRSEFGTRTIEEIVSGERSELMEQALIQASESSDQLGVEIVDVRVKQINLPSEVSESIYNRMRTERSTVAKEHRSQGQEQAEIIRSNIDAKVTVMLADAERQVREQRGDGDAQAALIYADAYSRSPEFYSFLRSMDAYRNSFKDKQDVLILQPDSEFFNYMKNAKGQ